MGIQRENHLFSLREEFAECESFIPLFNGGLFLLILFLESAQGLSHSVL